MEPKASQVPPATALELSSGAQVQGQQRQMAATQQAGDIVGFTATCGVHCNVEGALLNGHFPLFIPMTSILQSGLCVILRGQENFPAVKTILTKPRSLFPKLHNSFIPSLPNTGSFKFVFTNQSGFKLTLSSFPLPLRKSS